MAPNTGSNGYLFMDTDSEKSSGNTSLEEDLTSAKEESCSLLSDEEDSSSHRGVEMKSKKKEKNQCECPYSVAAIASLAATSCLLYGLEKRRQRRLTRSPTVMGQIPPNSLVRSAFEKLTVASSRGEEGSQMGILKRPITPSFLVGTNGHLASTAAYLSCGPNSVGKSAPLRFTETVTSSFDGASIDLVWEVPNTKNSLEGHRRKKEILDSANYRVNSLAIKIQDPIVLILHGINNSSEFGYMKSLQRTMTNRGWNAVAVNFRGCGPLNPMTTPRSYTASYTGDLRSIVHQISSRMQSPNGALFLVGNSLGASLLTKYLGEEGLAGTLPTTVKAAVSLGNPFILRANRIKFPVGALIGGARKANYLKQRTAIRQMGGTNMDSVGYRASRSALFDPRSLTLESLDRAMAPYMVRNALYPPYETRVGYGYKRDIQSSDNQTPHQTNNSQSGPAEAYWMDTGCFRQGRHVPVPLLHIQAKDDKISFRNGRQFLQYALQNPNVLFVETECGGHLGWWESSSRKGPRSWAQTAAADFFQAILDAKTGDSVENPANIDDALFAFRRSNGAQMDFHGETNGTNPSMRCLADDLSNGVTTISSMMNQSQASLRPMRSVTYYQVQEYLAVNGCRHGLVEEVRLRSNRILEQQDSLYASNRLRSRM